MRKLLPLAIALVLGGCGTVINRYAPEAIADAPIPAGSGRIILSTGAPRGCSSAPTYLKLLPEGATLREQELARPNVDSFALKSDFVDHQGNLHVIAVPAGNYYFAPWIDNPDIHPVRQPKATFSVAAGETVYLGEYYMPQSCGLSTLYEINDQMTRDMTLLKSMAPRFDTLRVTKRLMVLSGDVPL
jgi:hypothetical protein